MGKLDKKIHNSTGRSATAWDMPLITYPDNLPIAPRRSEIIKAIRDHRIVIVTGETGSGKTTQLPKMCLELLQHQCGLIGCTQPRRVAAVSAAHRIAEELGEEPGQTVGYKIRFDERSSHNGRIKIMTDGILLVEAQLDPLLKKYQALIVDEAHERSLNIDFILGLLRIILPQRHDLHVVITSATLDKEKFMSAFPSAPVISVSGRMYPVDIRWHPLDYSLNKQEEYTHVEAAIQAVENLKQEDRRGDILIFMPTEQDIRETCELLMGRSYEQTKILPMYARLSWLEQRRVFLPTPEQKIIVATNIAETSLTIPGISYVIDTGLARISLYNPRTRTTSLPIRPISQSSAEQRKGRCGRVKHGICIRLYSREDLASRPLYMPPEILRANLAEVILRMIALNLGDISSFPFVDSPTPRHIRDGIEVLLELGAVTEQSSNGIPSYRLTDKGRYMSRLPLDPRISRMIISGEEEGCLDEIFIIASALSIQDPREWPSDMEAEADKIHKSFHEPSSDFLTLLTLWRQYHKYLQGKPSQNRLRKFCRDHFLAYRRMREWHDVYEQIRSIYMEERPKRIRLHTITGSAIKRKAGWNDRIHRAVLSGLLSNIAMKRGKNIYIGAHGREMMIFPASGLWNRGGAWIVAAEIVETTRRFARTVATINPAWLEEIGAHLCRHTYFKPSWDNKLGQVIVLEQLSIYGLVIVDARPIPYGSIDPEDATRVFCRALASGEVAEPFPFLCHNRKLAERIKEMENKVRRRDFLVDDDEIMHFYEKRLQNVYDLKTLKKKIQKAGSDAFLRLKEADILRCSSNKDFEKLFPDELSAGRLRFPLAYRFAPGSETDGVTMNISWGMLPAASLSAIDWAVPGLLKEKVSTLLRELPKTYRKKIQPIQVTCDAFLMERPGQDTPLISALADFIHRRFNLDIPFSAWPLDRLPDYLRMRFVITDDTGKELISGRDFHHLLEAIRRDEESAAFEHARKQWERDDITDWNFADLPDYIILGPSGNPIGLAYPSLTAINGKIALRLFKNPTEAEISHRYGVSALYTLHFSMQIKQLARSIALKGYLKEAAAGLGGAKAVEKLLLDKVKTDLFACWIRTADAFSKHALEVAALILPHGQEVLKMAEPILVARHKTWQAIANLSAKHHNDPPVVSFLKDMENELNKLIPEDFLTKYQPERHPHLVRYLRTLVIRATRGALHVEKARQRGEEISRFEKRYFDLLSTLNASASPEKKKAIDDLFWMIAEYTVSLFAQEIKTAFPVSQKRLEEKIAEIARLG